VSGRIRAAGLIVLVTLATFGCGQQGPLVLPEQARPVERLETPPAAPPTTPEDEQRDER
jgi:predicted small lipoprotein YifL